MRRTILAAMAALTIFASVTASAASLGGVTATTVGANNVTIAACDTNGVASSYVVAYESALPAYEVTTVTIAGIADACNGKSMKVTLVNASNASLSEQTMTVAVDSTAVPADTSDDVSFATANVSAELVTGVHVSIVG